MKTKIYICKYCGRKGSTDELLHHICKRGVEKHYEEEDSTFLSTLILVDVFGETAPSDPEPAPEVEGGCGGEFSVRGRQVAKSEVS